MFLAIIIVILHSIQFNTHRLTKPCTVGCTVFKVLRTNFGRWFLSLLKDKMFLWAWVWKHFATELQVYLLFILWECNSLDKDLRHKTSSYGYGLEYLKKLLSHEANIWQFVPKKGVKYVVTVKSLEEGGTNYSGRTNPLNLLKQLIFTWCVQ